MSKYSDLDAHSRNCPSCIRVRDGEHGSGVGRGGKKHSLPCRKLAESITKIRRSTSSLSYADIVYRKEESFEGSTYLTPTQRKNNEIKKLRAELNKAYDIIKTKDEEIISLRKELVKFKGGLSPDYFEATSIPDSGNCEDPDSEHEPETSSVLRNIDFELMETTLREEEESRQQLSAENQDLKFQQENINQQIQELKSSHEDELLALQERFESERERLKGTHNERLEEVLTGLADTTLRCTRLQESIEKKQIKLDEQCEHLETLSSKLLTLHGEVQAKENLCIDKERQIKSLNLEIQRLSKDLESSEKMCERLKLEISQLKLELQCSQAPSIPGLDTNTIIQKLKEELAYSQGIIESQESDIKKIRSEEGGIKYLNPNHVSVQTENRTKVDNINQVDFWIDLSEDRPGEDESKENSILVTYQFLRRSIYYYLTDKDNKDYHLKSIERLLQFTEGEKEVIDRQKPLRKY